MANKYSRYELQPFPSLYVDNKQPEIAELLVNRYNQNKTSKDLIDRTLGQMELLDGDKAHLERVKGEVKGTLKDHISRGDWENSSLVVADAANMVATDAGLIASNRSMQNRQAEIAAVREARLNGISMLDFGASMRTTHQSYVYDENLKTYATNIYEPLSETQLDYRTRKEKMVGNIPSSQGLTWAGISRGQTNKTANLLVEQYITDTNEGKQEFKKLVELDLPSTIPLEERAKMAKAQILEDFRQVAQQQEYNKVIAPAGGGGSGGGNKHIVIQSTASKVNLGDVTGTVKNINENQVAFNKIINSTDVAVTQEMKNNAIIQRDNNQTLLKQHLKSQSATSPEAKKAYDHYIALEKQYDKYGKDGKTLFAMTSFLTYADQGNDTDWTKVATSAGIGAMAGSGGGWVGAGVGGLLTGSVGLGAELTKDFRGIRDWARPQENQWFNPTDSEREQLQEVIWGDMDLKDVDLKKVNKKLGTNFTQEQLKGAMELTNAHYSFMIKDSDGTRLTGDKLFEAAANEALTITAPTLTHGSTDAGIKNQAQTNAVIRQIPLDAAGITFDGMAFSNGEGSDFQKWLIDEVGGQKNLTLENIILPDIGSNNPLRLTFGSSDNASGAANRTAFVTDPSVVEPGGWVYNLLDTRYGSGDKVYDEALRHRYNEIGYDNVNMDQYTADMALKYQQYYGSTDEQTLQYKKQLEDEAILEMLIDPSFNFSQFEQNGVRGVKTQNGFIPFQIANPATGELSFNQAAQIELSKNPASLVQLRKQMLGLSLQDMGGVKLGE